MTPNEEIRIDLPGYPAHDILCCTQLTEQQRKSVQRRINILKREHFITAKYYSSFFLAKQPIAHLLHRKVTIPYPVTTYDAFVALHEIGHIVTWDQMVVIDPLVVNYLFKDEREPLLECLADKFALRECEMLGINTESLEACTKHHVFAYLMKHLPKIRGNKMFQEAHEWCGITQEAWASSGSAFYAPDFYNFVFKDAEHNNE